MQLKNLGNWVKDKVKALTQKHKEKPYTPPAPRMRFRKPYWLRNQLHYTAGAIARGRTLLPHCVARAATWRRKRIQELGAKIEARTATRKELREFYRITH